MAISPVRARARAQVAGLKRCVANGERAANDRQLEEAERNLKAIRLEEFVARELDKAPPLTDEQCDRIAALLRAGGAA